MPSSISDWLKLELEVLYDVLKSKKIPDARIEWPYLEEIETSVNHLHQARPLSASFVSDVFGVTDGARFLVSPPDESRKQSAFFHGFTQQKEVINLFVWNLMKELIHAGINLPGSWQDSKLSAVTGLCWRGLSYSMTPVGFRVLGDSALASNLSVTNGKLVRAIKAGEKYTPKSIEDDLKDMILQRIYPRRGKTADWGVQAI